MVSVLYCNDDIAVMMCKADRERTRITRMRWYIGYG